MGAVVHVCALHPRQARQNALIRKPGPVLFAVDEQRTPRRGPDGCRLGHVFAEQRVDERRFARARRTSDHGQQRRVNPRKPGKDVVVKLTKNFGRRFGAVRSQGRLERERDVFEDVAQRAERLLEFLLRSYGNAHLVSFNCGK